MVISASNVRSAQQSNPHGSYTLSSESPNERLKRLREQCGFVSAAEAARHMAPVNETTYQFHENGRRGISPDAAALYAAYLGSTADYILFGEHTIPVTGAVMENGRLGRPASAAPRSVVLPGMDASRMAAAIVATEALAPAYRPGDVVFWESRRSGIEPGAEGRECMVKTSDGERLLCIPHKRGQTWELQTYAERPRHNASLVWAAIIRVVTKHVPPA